MSMLPIQASNIHIDKPIRAAIEHLRRHNDTDGWNNLELVLGMNVDWHWLGKPIHGKTPGPRPSQHDRLLRRLSIGSRYGSD